MYYSNELYHFGIKRRSGRYPYGSGLRPFQSDPQKAMARRKKRAQRIESRTTSKFSRLDKKIDRRQKKADKEFNRAEKKSVSFFATQRGIDSAFEKAQVAQRRVHNLEYKGGQYYKRQQKKFSRMGLSMNSDLANRGMAYLNNVSKNTQEMYKMSLYKSGLDSKR